jgi:hypothetical protein
VTVTVTCTDDCGNSCSETFTITFEINEAPVCAFTDGQSPPICSPATHVIIFSSSDPDGDALTCTNTNPGATLGAGVWSYNPVPGEHVVDTIICTDPCGAACTLYVDITFPTATPPICEVPNDTTIFLCEAAAVCLPAFATGGSCVITSGPGTLVGSEWCYTPAGNETVTVSVECVSICDTCTASFSITFEIGAPPVITCPPAAGYQCAADVPACDPGTATVSGGTAPITVTCSSSDNAGSGCVADPLIITHTYIATDACGAADTCDQTITVIDDTAPPITCPAAITIECDASTDPANTGSATATDNCGGAVTIDHSDVVDLSGCGGYTGTITRTWTATDDCGNAASCDQIITLVDTAPPTLLGCKSDSTIECGGNPIIASVSAVDNCDQDVPVTRTDVFTQGSCPTIGTITYTWTAVDDCGNIAECTQSFTLIDSLPPVPPVCPADITVSCVADVPAPEVLTTTDVCDPNPTVTSSDGPLVGGACGGTITRTYTASDFCGNTSECVQIITINDMIPPVLVGCPANAELECGDPLPPAASVTATDNCGTPQVAMTETANLNGCGNTGTVTRQWVATDDCGNADTCAQVFTIVDTTDPVLSDCPTDVSVECGDALPSSATVTATDNCGDPSIAMTETPNLNSCGNTGTITRQWIATDECGNADTCTQVITIVDTTDPTLSGCPADVSIECGDVLPNPAIVTATDACGDAQVTMSETPNLNGCGGTGTVVRIWTATDDCGNTASCSQTITVADNTPPSIACPGDRFFLCDDIGDFGVATADDDCDAVPSVGIINRDSTAGASAQEFTLILTWEATDACGNSDQCDQLIMVTCPDSCGFHISIGAPPNGGSKSATPGVIEALNGTQVEVPVVISGTTTEIGGLDFLICYDPTGISILGVTVGDAITDWEYFTYRLGVSGNCGAGCPDGLVRIVALAELDNGVNIPEPAFLPVGTIANLIFQVTSDRNFIGFCISVGFCWNDCNDNTVASRSGDTTFISNTIAFSECQSNEKYDPVPTLCFADGEICIIEPPDDRGDLNLNGIANEVGDVVLYTNYFIWGSSVWDPTWVEVQLLASDVNDDGIVLTVADLIYMIRIVTGDETPFPANPKLSPYASSGNVSYRVDNNAMTVSTQSTAELGGGLFVFRYSGMGVGTPTLVSDHSGMTIRSSVSGGELRVLVSPDHAAMARIPAGHSDLFTVPVEGNGRIELVETQLSDGHGALMSVSTANAVLPESYALHQNYPNPFNAGTVIPFDLKSEGDWSLQVYNIAGQLVRSFAGHNSAGQVQVTWDGADREGRSVASGVYFYRLTSADFIASRKMTLIK